MARRASGLLALFLLLPSSTPAREPHVAKLEWRKVETPHLRVYSSVRDSKTREVVQGLDLLRGALETLLPRLPEAVEDPITVFLFADEKDYRPYREAFTADGEDVRGHLVAHPLGDFVAIDAYPREGSWSQPVAFHEMTHAYLENRYPVVPPWLHEGLSEYFSTFQRLRKAVQVGMPHPQHVLELRRSPFAPWEEVLAREETPKGEPAASFYRQSWLLVHFLMHGEEKAEGRRQREERQRVEKGRGGPSEVASGGPGDVHRYLSLLATGRDPGAFRDTFGLDPAALDTPLRAYVNRSAFDFVDLSLADLPRIPETRIRPAAAAEVLYRLGLLLALGGGADELAAQHFRSALDDGEADAGAGLAFLLEDQDPAAAEAAYGEAVAAGADDPLTFHLYGRWLIRRLRGEVPGPPPTLDRSREILARAVELAPEDPRPRALLGATWLFGDAPVDEGIDHLVAAFRGLPGRPAVLFNLAMLYLKGDRMHEAESLIAGPLAATGSELAEQAARELERKLLEQRVNRALGEGSPEDARRYIQEARSRADPLRAEELDRWLATVDAQARRQRETAIYNDAVTWANFGEWEEVVKRLRPLVEEGTVPDVVAAARKLLAEAEARLE